MILFDNKSSLRSLSCQQFLRLCSLPPHLCQTQQDHEDEAERHRYDLQQSRHCLLSLLLQDLEEDDIEETPRSDALEDDEGRVVDVLLVRAGESHTHPHPYRRHQAEDGHVEEGNQRPELQQVSLTISAGETFPVKREALLWSGILM